LIIKYESIWKFFTYYLLFVIYLGKPFVKITLVKNSEFYLVIVLFAFFLLAHSVELILKFFREKKFTFSECIYFLIFLYMFTQLLFLESLIFSSFKKFWIILSFSICILIFNKRSYIKKNLNQFYKINKNYVFFLSLFLLLQTLLGKAGTYGMIFYSNSYISQNIYDFKPQRIFIAVLFTAVFLNSKGNIFTYFLLLVNTALLLSFSRIIVIMFLFSLFIYLLTYKKYKISLYVFSIILLFLLSGAIDQIGNFSNRVLVDNEGKEFIGVVCARNFDDGIYVNDEELKQFYIKRNVDYGQYPTLPRYFSFSNILESLDFTNIKIPEFYITGKKDICNDYFTNVNLQSSYIEKCDFIENQKCLVQDTNPDLYKSQSQSAQLGGNVEFRTNLWKKVIEVQLNNDGKLFLGLDVQNSLPKTVDPDIDYGNLWHAHSSIISIFGFFGLSGIFLFLLTVFSVIKNQNKFDNNYIIVFVSVLLLSVTDGVLETPDLSIIFSLFLALIKSEEKY
tara:strand:+ start:1916 stop:3433 length:1518 start_codon:yes stop_codon:yes gene_type:complete